MKKPVFGLLFLLILLVAILFRSVHLDLRPMHHDEANQAVKFGSLLDNGEYRYDRIDHHGPTLYYLSLPIVRILTGPKFADTNEITLRLVPALFGIGIIILLLLLKDALPGRDVIFTALVIAVSPLMSFYSRFYIQEMLLLFFTMGTVAAGWRYYRNPNAGWAVLTGFFTGMMYTTKETCLIIFAALTGALILTRITTRRTPNTDKKVKAVPVAKDSGKYSRQFHFRHVLYALAAALLITIIFYSSFFKNPTGPVDSVLAFKSYLSKAGEPGFHVHPWYYYIKMLAFSKYGSGPAWSEGFILILTVIGCIALIRGKVSRSFSRVFVRFVFFYTLLAAIFFSIIPYKTPWNMLPFYIGMIILAGAGSTVILPPAATRGAFLKNRPPGPPEKLLLRQTHNSSPDNQPAAPLTAPHKKILFRRIGALLFLFVGITHLSIQSFRANFKYYADNRNPYVYVHTVNDFKRLFNRIENISALHPDHYSMLIKVITGPYDTWPLPYYLRKFNRVGYWQNINKAGNLDDTPIIVTSLDRDEKVREKLKSDYQVEFYGLRPEVLLVVYIKWDLWQEFMRTRVK